MRVRSRAKGRVNRAEKKVSLSKQVNYKKVRVLM